MAGRNLGPQENGELYVAELTVRAVKNDFGVVENYNGLMRNVDIISGKLSKLHEEKIKLAIDDFGTGHSSLAYLKKFPVQTLKIDKRFILEIDKDGDNKTIATAVIALAKSLGIKVIAEGSETQAQVDALTALDCHKGQGYFYSKPILFGLFERFLIKGA